jgi:hypothetical protein
MNMIICKFSKHLLTMLLVSLLSGCLAHKNLEQGDALGQGESIVVIGVKPSQFRVSFEDATVVNGKVEISPFRMVRIGATPRDGYVVARVPGGTTMAMTAVGMTSLEGRSTSSRASCGNEVVSVLTVPAGSVVYFGDISGERMPNGGFRTLRTFNLDAAKEHLLTNYKGFSQRLQPADVKALPIERTCPSPRPPVTVPIYVPRSR